MQKGFTPLLILVGALLAFGAAYFVPILYYQKEDIGCKENSVTCIKKGWQRGHTLWETIDSKYLHPLPDPIQIFPSPSTSTNTETANWKTYTNTKYGYSIKYPHFLKQATDSWVPADKSYAIFVLSYADGVGSGLEFNAITSSNATIEIVGQKVRKLIGIEVVSEKGTLIHIGPVKHEGQNYMLIYSSVSQEADTKGLAVFNQMISTFKFLNQEANNGCKVTGCSGQICAEEEEDLVTTCEFRDEYACYKTARCERQADGKCGWTETEELKSCLEKYN